MHPSAPPPPATASPDKIPVPTKIVYGLGTAPDMWGNWLYPGLVNPVFNIHLGLAPWLISLVLMLQRVFDAITDPIIGWLSDNTRSRWGRRRPWILFGGIASGLGLPLLFTVGADWEKSTLAIYMFVTALLYMPVISAYNMPYQSLGAELTPDYHERTRLMAFKGVIQKFTEIVFFLGIPFATLSWFQLPDAIDPVTGAATARYDILRGVQIYTAIVGFLMIVVSVLGFVTLKERHYARLVAAPQKKVRLRDAFTGALRCRPFRLLLINALVYSLGTSMVGSLGFYATVYYVCGGDLQAGGRWNMFMGFAYSGGALLSVPVAAWLAGRWGKRHAALASCFFAIGVFAATWWLYDPRLPWLQPLASGLIGMASAASGMLTGSMLADVMDYDELSTGQRREGSFSACFSWFIKLGIALGMGGSGVMLSLTGFDAAHRVQPESVLTNIRLYLALLPIAGSVVAAFAIWRYTLTREQMGEIRAALELRRGTV